MTVSPPERNGTISTRQLRIAAIAGGAVLIVGLAVAVGTAGGQKPKHEPTPTVTHSAAAAPPASTSPPPAGVPPVVSGSPSTSSSSSPSASGPVVRWHGRLTVSGSNAHRDLDSVPPRTYEQDGDLTGDWLETTLKADSDGVQIAVVTGSPGYRECRDAVAANGTDHTERLRDGDMVCVLTSQGRVARLRVLNATQTSGDPVIETDATVWDPPLPH